MRLPHRTVLDNGAVLVSQPSPSNPFIALRGSLSAGMAAEGKDEAGVAEFMARLMLGGTKRASAGKLADRLEALGATLEFQNSSEALVFHGRCTRETLGATIRTLVECLSSPAFPAKEVERVRGEILNDFREERDDTRHRAMRELARILFPRGHPYGRDPKGGPERVRAIRRKDIVSFHEAHMGPERLMLAVAGDVDRKLIEEKIAGPIQRLRGDSYASEEIPPPAGIRPRAVRIPMPHKAQADIVVGAPAVPRRHEDYYALRLANLLFGRIGMYGRLGLNLREEQGLAYYAGSNLEARTAGGSWTISAGVNPANLEKAIRGIRAELDRLRTEPFTAEEIQEGKDSEVGSLAVGLDRNAELVAELHRMEYFRLGMDYFERYADIIREIPEDRIPEVALRYFDPAACSVVVAGPIGRARVGL